MKHSIIFSALIVILASSTVGMAQASRMRVTFSESINPLGGGMGMGKVTVQDVHFNPDVRVFEALIPASSAQQCYASRDFSGATPVGADRASLSYDFSQASYDLKIVIGQGDPDKCRVLLVGETISTADLAVWRANFGQTGIAESGLIKDDEGGARSGDGSVRRVSYQIDVHSWSW